MQNVGTGERKAAVILLTPSERCGSSWFLSLLYAHPKVMAKTEPLRQQIPIQNPVHPLSHSPIGPPSMEQLLSSCTGSRWWRDFNAWICTETRPTVIKETNLYFRYNWLVNNFKNRCNVVVLSRDVLSIAGSFRRGRLFERWNYIKVFEIVIGNIMKESILKKEYSSLLEIVNAQKPMQVIAFLYLLNSNEMYKSVSNASPLYLDYEDVVSQPLVAVSKVLSLLGLIVTEEVKAKVEASQQVARHSGSEGDHDYATTRRSAEDNWKSVLCPEDLTDLNVVVHVGLSSLPTLKEVFEKGIFRPFYTISFPAPPLLQSSCFSRSSREVLESRPLVVYELTCDEVRMTTNEKMVYFMDLQFGVCKTLTSNKDFVSFLNAMKQQGFPNVQNDLFVLFNEGMLPDRGGRIFVEASSKKYAVLQGYENHPVNWLMYAGADLFCRWIGGRLIRGKEYDHVEASVCPAKLLERQNIGNIIGDTVPITKYEGKLNDLKGNVCTWTGSGAVRGTQEKHYSFRFSKGGAFNAPIRAKGHQLEKPEIFSGRDMGVRVASSIEGLKPYNYHSYLEKLKVSRSDKLCV